jgi:hypothetical protein
MGAMPTCPALSWRCYILGLRRGDTASQVVDLCGLANMGSTPAASTTFRASPWLSISYVRCDWFCITQKTSICYIGWCILNIIPYLACRGGVYYFRRVMPLNIRFFVGRREIIRSLGAHNLKVARKLVIEMVDELDKLFSKIQIGIEPLSPSDLAVFNNDLITWLLRCGNFKTFAVKTPLKIALAFFSRSRFGWGVVNEGYRTEERVDCLKKSFYVLFCLGL